MKSEIDKDFYCSAISYKNGVCNKRVSERVCCKERCDCYHRKWLTPEQFKEEYGEEYPDDGAVWYRFLLFDDIYGCWDLSSFSYVKKLFEVRFDGQIVCACTPFGKPDADWRP